jgi:molecular chaperone GrpE
MNDERFDRGGEATAGNGDAPDLELDLDAADSAGDDPAATVIVPESERLRAEVADWRDRSLRTLADFDNFRKRAERDKEEVRKYALADFLREFVAVADNFDLALRSGGSGEDLRRGVEMIHRQFDEHLRRFGLRSVEALGAEFDPAVHEAVARREDADVTRPTVVAELRKGYFLGDRLLRPAMVEVAVPVETPTRAAVEGEST